MNQPTVMNAAFLSMETPQTPMHIGSLFIVEPAPGSGDDFHERFKAHLARRMHLAPSLAVKLSSLPLEGDPPAWAKADPVDLDHHLRRLALPRPGTWQQLEELVGRLHSNVLDRSRPLWECYVIDGLESRQAALYVKLHRAAIDDDTVVQLTDALFDTTATPREVEPPPAEASSTLGLLGLLGAAQGRLLREQMRTLQMIPDAWKTLARAMLPGTGSPPDRPSGTAPVTLLDGPVTGQRAYAARSVRQDDALRIADQSGVGLDDVLLAACGAALRRYLQSREALPAGSLIAQWPAAPRGGDDAAPGEPSQARLVSLASNIAEPMARLQTVAESVRQSSATPAAAVGDDAPLRAFSILGAPPMMQGPTDPGQRPDPAGRRPSAANVAVSSARGPAVPLYVAGAKLLALYPVSIPTHGAALNIAAQSYDGSLDIGFTACGRRLADVAAIADLVVAGFDELARAVPGPAAASAIRPPEAAPVPKPEPARPRRADGAPTEKAQGRATTASRMPSVQPVPAASRPAESAAGPAGASAPAAARKTRARSAKATTAGTATPEAAVATAQPASGAAASPASRERQPAGSAAVAADAGRSRAAAGPAAKTRSRREKSPATGVTASAAEATGGMPQPAPVPVRKPPQRRKRERGAAAAAGADAANTAPARPAPRPVAPPARRRADEASTAAPAPPTSAAAAAPEPAVRAAKKRPARSGRPRA